MERGREGVLVGEVFARMGLDDKRYIKDLNRLEGITEKKALALGSIFKGAFSFAIGVGIFQGFRSLGGAITDFVNTAARTEVLDVAMMAVARSTRHTTAEIREQEEALRDLGIAKQEAKQMLTRFMQAQIDVADVTKLARVAQDAAVIAGYNSSEAAQQMTEAIAKQRPELLSAFGFTRNLNDIYNDYAKTVGKTVKQLSEVEKKQAMVYYILREGEKIAGTYEASMGAVGKIIGSLKRYWDDLKDAIAMPLALPALNVIVEGVTNALKNAIAWAEANKITLQMWGQALVNVFKNVATVAQRVFSVIGSFAKFVIRNWVLISRSAMVAVRAFLLFKIIPIIMSKASRATMYFKSIVAILQGRAVGLSGSLRVLSIGLEYYRYQLHLANMAGITSVGVAARVVIGIKSIGIAIKGLLASIPVIGWIVLAIGLLAEAGIYAYHNWEKVKNYGLQAWSALKQGIAYYVYGILSLYRLLFGWIPGVGAAFDVLKKKALDVARAETEIRKARAAAYAVKSVDPYTEYEKKMEEYYKQLEEYDAKIESSLAGAKDGVDDTTDSVKDLGKAANKNLMPFDELNKLQSEIADNAAGGIDDFNLGELGETPGMPEMPKMPTLDETGFLDKIKNIWGDITGGISTGVADAWAEYGDTMKEAMEAYKDGWKKFWEKLSLREWWHESVAPWFTKEKWLELYDNMRTSLQETWEKITTWWGNTAFAKWWNESVAPWFTKEKWLELYQPIGTALQDKWDELVAWWNSTAYVKWWNNDVAPWFKKDKWKTLYSTLKTELQATWNDLKTWWANTTYVKWWNQHVAPWFEKGKWKNLYKSMKTAMQDVWKEIENWWNGTLIGKAFNWGRNLIGNITDGIRSRVSDVRNAVSNVAGTISDYLRFWSPAEKGPGRDADKWAPNLISMYSQGILQNTSMVTGAVGAIAQQLAGLATTVTPSFADAKLAPAFSGVGAGQAAAAAGGAGVGDIYVYIGNEQVDAYIHRSQDRRNTRSNGR